jgi:hypothetical protein
VRFSQLPAEIQARALDLGLPVRLGGHVLGQHHHTGDDGTVSDRNQTYPMGRPLAQRVVLERLRPTGQRCLKPGPEDLPPTRSKHIGQSVAARIPLLKTPPGSTIGQNDA